MRGPFFLFKADGGPGNGDSPMAIADPSGLLGRLRPWSIWLGLAAVLLLATVLRLILRLGLSNRDSFDYVLAAMKLNEYGIVHYLSDISSIYENRVAIVFPLAAIFRLLGVTEFSATLLPFSAALLTIALVFAFAYFISPRAGLIAALIVATLPQEVGLATSVLPDSLIPLYTGACLLCLWHGLRHEKTWLYVLSGFFLFLAFQSRATGAVLIIPLVLIAMWSSRRSLRAIVIPTATFFVLLALFWLLIYVIAGDPLVQYQWLVRDGSMKHFAGTGEFLGHFKSIVLRLNPDFGLLFHLAILALLLALFRSRGSEKYRLPLLAFVCLYLFFEFGSTSLTSYLPIWKLGRFLTILTVPAALLIAFAADDILSADGRAWRYLVFALVSVQVVLGAAYVLTFGDFITTAVHAEKDTYERVIQRLDDYDGKTVAVVNERWTEWGAVYAAFQGNGFEFRTLEGVSRESLSPDAIVIFAPTLITAYGNVTIDRDQYPALDGLPGQTPPGWELLFVEPLVEPPAKYDGDPVWVYRIVEQ